jgi:hypothetical protein
MGELPSTSATHLPGASISPPPLSGTSTERRLESQWLIAATEE